MWTVAQSETGVFFLVAPSGRIVGEFRNRDHADRVALLLNRDDGENPGGSWAYKAGTRALTYDRPAD